MEKSKVERLIEKYKIGKTSPAEVKYLKDYFTHKKVPPHLEPYRDSFKTRNQSQKSIGTKASGKKFYVWGGITAILIFIFGVFLLMQNDSSSFKTKDLGTIQEEEIALEKTKETLRMVSELMNNSKKDLGYLKEFNTTREKIIKHE